ncbi:Arc family DNA-binding protein [Komagataeibacter sp. FNDCF1]|uniref:Arc family DNA-binding protein n=1 Tax=Komagataeibacter sp. FNDCF1 TaxID=2878681 RepID=UPI00351CF679|nr:Arc family DNA-binding protein [Komagataeibacter sp. FNDCF1]
MTETASITFRMERTLLHYLRGRAAKNDRSINKEFLSIVRTLAETEKASDQPGSTSDASE